MKLFRIFVIVSLVVGVFAIGTPVLAQSPTAEPEADIELEDADVYTVQSGDTLSLIAQRELGDSGRFREILVATLELAETDARFPVIEDANIIEPGWNLVIPREAIETEADIEEEDVLENETVLLPGEKGGAFDTYNLAYDMDTKATVRIRYAPAGRLIDEGFGFNVWGPDGLVDESSFVGVQAIEEVTFNAEAGVVYLIQVFNYNPETVVGYQLIVDPDTSRTFTRFAQTVQ